MDKLPFYYLKNQYFKRESKGHYWKIIFEFLDKGLNSNIWI